MAKTKEKQYSKSFSDKLSISNTNLQKIIKFYLFECPVPGKSVRGRVFEDYGIKGSVAFSRLKKHMFEAATNSLKDNYLPSSKADLPDNYRKVEAVHPPDEYCVFFKTDESSIMQSLYSAIRNAFAHGSFLVKNYDGVRIYFLSNYHDYLKAEIVLHEETLLKWINCIQNFM